MSELVKRVGLVCVARADGGAATQVEMIEQRVRERIEAELLKYT
jgi:hypothetical protein